MMVLSVSGCYHNHCLKQCYTASSSPPLYQQSERLNFCTTVSQNFQKIQLQVQYDILKGIHPFTPCSLLYS